MSIPHYLPEATAPLVAFVITLGLTWWLIHGSALRIMDHPNPRSLHVRPVPRTGGLGMVSGVLAAWILAPVTLPFSVFIGVALLALISLVDDAAGLRVLGRLAMHVAVAAWVSVALLLETKGWAATVLATVATIWMVNLYNFMDGSDGLAGGMALIGFSCYGLIAWLGGNTPFASINFSIAASAAAFLCFNFFPARIFMGDAGSIPLGFMAASFGVIGWTNGLWPVWLPVLVFSPFIADASATLAKRSFRGEKLWQAHRHHYYQRLVNSGLGHRNTALLGYMLMAAVSASAVAAIHQDEGVQLGIVSGWGAIYLLLMVACDRYLRRRRKRYTE